MKFKVGDKIIYTSLAGKPETKTGTIIKVIDPYLKDRNAYNFLVESSLTTNFWCTERMLKLDVIETMKKMKNEISKGR